MQKTIRNNTFFFIIGITCCSLNAQVNVTIKNEGTWATKIAALEDSAGNKIKDIGVQLTNNAQTALEVPALGNYAIRLQFPPYENEGYAMWNFSVTSNNQHFTIPQSFADQKFTFFQAQRVAKEERAREARRQELADRDSY